MEVSLENPMSKQTKILICENVKKKRQIDSVLHDYAQDFDEFFMSNSCLKITRQIELVLQYFAYECCNLTIFSNQIAI